MSKNSLDSLPHRAWLPLGQLPSPVQFLGGAFIRTVTVTVTVTGRAGPAAIVVAGGQGSGGGYGIG
jgi:hypothetical protein